MVDEVRRRIEVSRRTLVVAISGYGGAGKSTLARHLHAAFPGSVILAIDDYYAPIPLPDDDWAAYDRTQLRSAIQPLLENQEVRLIVCEGVGLLHPDSLDLYDLKVWVDVELDVATAQGMRRDQEEYQVDHDRLWREEWVPTEVRFEAKHDPKSRADYFV